jgi:LysM repeat protein
MKRKVWRSVIASLLFILAACSPAPNTPTQLPTAQIQLSTSIAPTSTEASSTSQTRTEIETYIVVAGDSISSIAAAFDLQPETILWANYDLLLDDPDYLLPGMQLTILPVDGVYHQAGGGDSVQSLAAFFAADAQAIVDWPGNQIDSADPQLFVGQWVLIPGGTRGLRRRFLPNLPRNAMAVDPIEYGVGACPENVFIDVAGDGNYSWPVDDPTVRGDGFWSAHPGLDLSVALDGEVRAADDGVVVFSGWSNFGYGNTIILDHGNGDFSIYAGLSTVIANCGSSVEEGTVIATGGMSGHPSEPFVHFEIRHGEDFLDPSELID